MFVCIMYLTIHLASIYIDYYYVGGGSWFLVGIGEIVFLIFFLLLLLLLANGLLFYCFVPPQIPSTVSRDTQNVSQNTQI